MKRILLLLLCLSNLISTAQITTSTQWTWVKGDNTLDMPGVYGVQGVYDILNKPGARDGAISWTDVAGNFWLFGGNGFGTSRGLLNDLWKYDVATNRWAWMKGSNDIGDEGEYGTMGIADPLNDPGARHLSISWTDGSGNLWLFGGIGLSPSNPQGFLNDLWKYNPITNQWTWVSGDNIPDQASEFGTQGISDPANKPGSRSGAVSWIDATGKLWLFGGLSYDFFLDPAYSNDLWQYDPITGEWTWMKGNFTLNESGIYGVQTIPDVNNNPGGRTDAGNWIDASGNFWLFGGEGFDEGSGIGPLNDLWRYNIASNTWTWMKGDNVTNQIGVYGTAGVSADANKPGARFRSYTWKDPSGLLWLYGGNGYGSSLDGLLADLWKYNTASNQWTWMKGDGNVNVNTVYGSQGTSSPTTRPGSRRGGVTFRDPAGNLWLFGGNGYDAAGGTDLLNDLWKLGDFTIVPVTGLNLYVTRVQNEVQLSWQTEQEINTEHFEIERSSDGIHFTSIGTLNAAGNSNTRIKYSYSDYYSFPLTSFYRIKVYDTYGSSFSNTVVLRAGIKPLQLFPNPVKNILYVQVSGISNGSVIQVINMEGKKLKEQILTGMGTISLTIDVSTLATGMYVLIVKNGTLIQQQQFIKQ